MEKCKCCLIGEPNMKNLWSACDSDGICEIYGEMIQNCFVLDWDKPPDTNPEHICRNCIKRLCNAYNFKKEMLYSEQILQNITKVSEENVKEQTELDEGKEPVYLNTEFLQDVHLPDEMKSIETNFIIAPIMEMEKEECVPTNTEEKLSPTTAPIINTPNKAVKKTSTTKITKKAVKPSNTKKNPELQNCQENLDCVIKYTNATPFKNLNRLEYCCYFCPKGYKKPSDLKNHTKEHLESHLRVMVQKGTYVKLDITNLQCNICGLKPNSLENMLEHLKLIHKKNIHTVTLKKFMPFNFEDDGLKCVICARRFITFRLLNNHMNAQHYSNYLCNECGRVFISRKSLQNHLQRHATGEFPCRYCDKVFTTHLRRNAHQRGVHFLFSKRNKCNYCGEKFVTLEGKKNHEVKVHGAPKQDHQCEICDKSYNSQRSLRIHVRSFHLQHLSHKCTECNYSAYSQIEMKIHMVTHSVPPEYTCEVCSKSFGKKLSLGLHMRTHTKYCRVKCDHCKKSFSQKCTLSAHIHTKHADKIA